VSDVDYTRPRTVPHGVVRSDLRPPPEGPANLADILERVLDKGIVIAGDIQVNLLDIELLTIKIRLLIASVDRAKEMGINWWESDPTLSAQANELATENEELRARLERLERELPGALGDEERRTVTQRSRESFDDGERRTVTEQRRSTVTERRESEAQ
jgi:hypothetical protein